MPENTKIEWTQHTGSPWFVCDPVSPGCANCYAWELAVTRLEPIIRNAYKKAGFQDWQTRPVWGKNATRVLSKGFWNDAKRLNASHAKAGTVGTWFPSMMDWLDVMPVGIIDQDGKRLDPIEVLARLLKLIHDTPNLHWLLLTKRPENWYSRISAVMHHCDEATGEWLEAWTDCVDMPERGDMPSNVSVIVSVENQPMADLRIPQLLNIPARIRGLSLEPLLGPVDLAGMDYITAKAGLDHYPFHLPKDARSSVLHGIDWLIIGGESGPGARPCNVEWIRSLVRQGKQAGVPVFVKQLGAFSVPRFWNANGSKGMKHPKGGDPSEWPEDLRIREFPDFQSLSESSASEV